MTVSAPVVPVAGKLMLRKWSSVPSVAEDVQVAGGKLRRGGEIERGRGTRPTESATEGTPMSAPWRAPAAVPEYRMSVPRFGPWLMPEITRSIAPGHEAEQGDHDAVRRGAAAGELPLPDLPHPERSPAA